MKQIRIDSFDGNFNFMHPAIKFIFYIQLSYYWQKNQLLTEIKSIQQKFIYHCCLNCVKVPLDVKVFLRPLHNPPDSFRQLHTFVPHNTFACNFCKI